MMNKHKISTVVLFILILIGVAGAVVVNIDGSALVAKTNLTTCIGNNATQWNGTVGNCILTSSGGVTNATVNPYSFNAANATGTLPVAVMPANVSYNNSVSVVKMYNATDQYLPDGVSTKITLDVKLIDTNSEVLNSNFTAKVTGYYLVMYAAQFRNNSAPSINLYIDVFKNGVRVIRKGITPSVINQEIYVSGTDYIQMNAGDYIDLRATSYAGNNNVYIVGSSLYSYLSVNFVRS